MKVKLGDLIEEYSERNIDNKYKPVAVGKYGIRARESIYSKELAKDYSKNKLIYKGTLTIGMGSNQIDIGILRDDEIYSVSPAYHTYNIKISNYDYLDYLLTANNNRMFSIYANRGSRQGKTLDLKRWLTDELRLHDEKDQKIIVQTLNAVKQLISQKEAELVKLDNLIKARFVEMFGGEQCAILQDLSDRITDGSHLPPKGVEKSDYLMLSSQNIFDEINRDGARFLSKEDFENENRRTDIKDGDVLVTIVGTIGRTHIVRSGEKYVFQRSVGVIKPKSGRLNGIYLASYLQTCRAKAFLTSRAHGSSQKGIYLQDLKKLPVPLVPMALQNQFAAFVAQVDKSKFVLSNELTMCDFYIRLIHDRVMHSRINLRVAQ